MIIFYLEYIFYANSRFLPAITMLRKLEIKTIVADKESQLGNYIVYLYDKKEKILLPIKVGAYAGESLIMALQNSPMPRPHIHDTARRIVHALSGEVDSVVITDCTGEIFYSYLRLKTGSVFLDIDAKPSDSIAIAIRAGAPVYAKESLLKKAGILLTRELLNKFI